MTAFCTTCSGSFLGIFIDDDDDAAAADDGDDDAVSYTHLDVYKRQ